MSMVKIQFDGDDKEHYVEFDELSVEKAVKDIKEFGSNLFIVVGVGDMKIELLRYWTGSNIKERETVFELLRMVVKQYDLNKFKEVKKI